MGRHLAEGDCPFLSKWSLESQILAKQYTGRSVIRKLYQVVRFLSFVRL